MRLANTLKIILVVVIGLGTLAVVYIVEHQRKRVPISLTPIQTASPAPSTIISNSPISTISTVTPNPTPTTTPKIDTLSWKTYRNEEYKYEIKYPKDFIFKENNYGMEFLTPNDIAYQNEPDSPFFILIHIEEINPNENIEDYIKKTYEIKEVKEFEITLEDGNQSTIDSIKKIEIGKDVKGYFIHQWIQAIGECHYLGKSKNLLIDISRSKAGLTYSSCLSDPVFHWMITTFKFIK
jgi:hypothetical protein